MNEQQAERGSAKLRQIDPASLVSRALLHSSVRRAKEMGDHRHSWAKSPQSLRAAQWCLRDDLDLDLVLRLSGVEHINLMEGSLGRT